MEREEGQLGYIKYSGELVRDGYLDARKSAQALLGVDEAVRFFVFQQAPVYLSPKCGHQVDDAESYPRRRASLATNAKPRWITRTARS